MIISVRVWATEGNSTDVPLDEIPADEFSLAAASATDSTITANTSFCSRRK